MNSNVPRCPCTDEAHHTIDGRPACCWCWVVDSGRLADPSHHGCDLARKRIEPIQVRFRTAVAAEREACARICETLDTGNGKLTPEFTRAIRQNPRVVLGHVAEALGKNLAIVIRARIG